jgi:hypothetical protein
MLEAIVARHVAFGRRKKNNAEDSAAHRVSIHVNFRRNAQVASSRPISIEGLVMLVIFLELGTDAPASLTTD